MNRLDKLKARIDEMDAREMAMLLKCKKCRYCIYNNANCMRNAGATCEGGIQAYLEQEIQPPKTLADVFFERNPKAGKNELGQPRCCAKNAGLTDKCLNAKAKIVECKCFDCWNRPYEEEKGDIE